MFSAVGAFQRRFEQIASLGSKADCYSEQGSLPSCQAQGEQRCDDKECKDAAEQTSNRSFPCLARADSRRHAVLAECFAGEICGRVHYEGSGEGQ